MALLSVMVFALGLSTQVRAEPAATGEAVDALAHCSGFTGPLIANDQWIGAVDKQDRKLATGKVETKFVFQALRRVAFVGSENASVSLAITRVVDSSSVAADAPSAVSFSCELLRSK